MSRYKYIMIPIISLVLCQIIKFFIESYEAKEYKWGRLFKGSGGMPSSHSTLVSSLTFMLIFNEGLTSPLSAIGIIVSLIVCYDAMGVRFESGKQAQAINQIVDEIFSENSNIGIKKLKEQLGHKPKEVFAGLILGLITSLVYTYIVL